MEERLAPGPHRQHNVAAAPFKRFAAAFILRLPKEAIDECICLPLCLEGRDVIARSLRTDEARGSPRKVSMAQPTPILPTYGCTKWHAPPLVSAGSGEQQRAPKKTHCSSRELFRRGASRQSCAEPVGAFGDIMENETQRAYMI